MKHIFVVHSHITYLVALGVVIQEGLDDSQVMILSENYRSAFEPINIIQVRISESYKSLLKNRKYKKIFNTNIDIDDIVSRFVQEEEFIAYIPVFHLINRYLVTHSKCIKYNIIEEGLAAYYDYFSINQHALIAGNRWRYSKGIKGVGERISDIKLIIKGITPSILAIPTFYTAYASNPNICFYGFHNCSHLHSCNRKTLEINRIIEYYNFQSQYNLDNSVIWIGDPDIFVGCCDEEFDSSINRSLINYINNYNVKKVYIKFHYRETDIQKQRLIQLLQQARVNYEIMEDSSIMEVELVKSYNVTLVGIYSSLLVYGGIIGHKSISICDYLPITIKNKVESINKQISVFWKFVEKINIYI